MSDRVGVLVGSRISSRYLVAKGSTSAGVVPISDLIADRAGGTAGCFGISLLEDMGCRW